MDRDNKTLVHAVRGATGGWTVKPIAGTREGANDLVVDAKGQLHLVAPGSKSYTLVYHRYSGAVWTSGVVLSAKGNFPLRKPGVAVDGSGRVHVVHGTSDDQLLYLVSEAGSGFGQPVVLATGMVDVGAAMALDAKGRAHVIYNNQAEQQLYYTAQNTAGGQFSTPAALGKLALNATTYFGNYADLVHHEGTLWLAYANDKNHLVVRKRSLAQSGWQPPQSLSFCCGSMLSAAMGTDDALRIAHWNTYANRLSVTKVCPE